MKCSGPSSGPFLWSLLDNPPCCQCLEPGWAERGKVRPSPQGPFLLNLAWFVSSWFICGNERGVAASSPDSPARTLLRHRLHREKTEPLSLCLCFLLFLVENTLLSLPPGGICLSQVLSSLMEFHPLPYRWVVALPLSICCTCTSVICPFPQGSLSLAFCSGEYLGIIPRSSISLARYLFFIVDAVHLLCGVIWGQCCYSNCKPMEDQWDRLRDKIKPCSFLTRETFELALSGVLFLYRDKI